MWLQLNIETCLAKEAEILSETLETLGALSITLTDKYDNPVLEPLPGTTPLWPDVKISALFTDLSTAQLASACLSPQYPHLQFGIETLPDEEWEKVWMKDFKPQQFGEKLWICPSWSEPPDRTAVNIKLDPGLAFGTGTHPTTALCLTWLSQADLVNKQVIDYGCGSGILAIAAARLGANPVFAVDIDQQALDATKSNAKNNAIQDSTLQIGFPEHLNTKADLLIANILLTPLESLKDRFQSLLKPDGLLVVSGLLSEQADLLIQSYQETFSLLSEKHQAGWALLTFAII